MDHPPVGFASASSLSVYSARSRLRALRLVDGRVRRMAFPGSGTGVCFALRAEIR
jgi:hypothetical protein